MLQSSEHLSGASLLPREITQGGCDVQGCDAFIVVGDADQSRLLVSNSTHDTALSHASIESILTSHKKVVLAVVGGRTRGFRNPVPPNVWSDTVENVLRKTQQTLALQVPPTSRHRGRARVCVMRVCTLKNR